MSWNRCVTTKLERQPLATVSTNNLATENQPRCRALLIHSLPAAMHSRCGCGPTLGPPHHPEPIRPWMVLGRKRHPVILLGLEQHRLGEAHQLLLWSPSHCVNFDALDFSH